MAGLVRSIGNGLHPVGPLTTVNYALNPSMEVLDSTVLSGARTNLCTNPNFEYGTTGWSSGGTNGPTLSQSIARAYLGTKSLLASWQSAATSPAIVGPSINMVSGTTYTVSCLVWVPTGSPAVRLTISATNGTASSLNNQWQRISLTYTAVATAATPVSITPATATSAGQLAWVDSVLFEQASALGDYFDGDNDLSISRTNLCTNPSFETNTTGWSGVTMATDTSQHLVGKQSLSVTWPGTGSPKLSYSFSTTSGVIYTISMFVYVPSGNPHLLLTISGFSNAGQTSTLFDAWERLSFTFTATGATSVLNLIPTDSNAGSCFIDNVLIEQGVLNEYFDGSLPPFNSVGITQTWTGTAHASTSTQHVPNGLLAWTGTAGSSTSTRSKQAPKWWTIDNAVVSCEAVPGSGVSGQIGPYGAMITPLNTSTIPMLSQTFNVFDSTTYSVSFRTFIPAAITGGGLVLEFISKDSLGNLVLDETVPLLLNGNATVGYIRVAAAYQTPATTATLQVGIRPTNIPSSTADIIYVDDFMFEQADFPAPQYLDGSCAGYTWSGTAKESTSLQTEFPDALNFFGTYIWQNLHTLTVPLDDPTTIDRKGAVAMGAHATLHEAPWSPVPLTD